MFSLDGNIVFETTDVAFAVSVSDAVELGFCVISLEQQ